MLISSREYKLRELDENSVGAFFTYTAEDKNVLIVMSEWRENI